MVSPVLIAAAVVVVATVPVGAAGVVSATAATGEVIAEKLQQW